MTIGDLIEQLEKYDTNQHVLVNTEVDDSGQYFLDVYDVSWGGGLEAVCINAYLVMA